MRLNFFEMYVLSFRVSCLSWGDMYSIGPDQPFSLSSEVNRQYFILQFYSSLIFVYVDMHPYVCKHL